MVHSGIGTQYDCQFVLARKRRKSPDWHRWWMAFWSSPGILARELVLSSMGPMGIGHHTQGSGGEAVD